jgi:enoyl-CoA hydratase
MAFALTSGDVLAEARGALGLITLNRPAVLNALNEPMVEGITRALLAWRDDPAIRHVAIRGAGGKAFCAGGDIRQMHDLGRAGQYAEALAFWRDEYRLNAMIHAYPKPYIALVDGIVMGGGVGVSLHGSHRLAGPNYLFAMPEVGIGFFPDVGATYALPRLKEAFGAYLALTGARMKRDDAMMLGLATHAVSAGSEPAILDALAAGEAVETIAARHADIVGDAPLATHEALIHRLFSTPNLPAIITALEGEGELEGKWDTFSAKTLEVMRTKSPTSMALALMQMQRGGNLTFEEAMRTEFRIVSRLVRGHDFYEGVRAVIIDKDNAPRWNPATLDQLDEQALTACFAPLEDDLTFPAFHPVGSV